MTEAKILRLNRAGVPLGWLTREEAATAVVNDKVIWTLGDSTLQIRGGVNRAGKQSVLNLPTIVACEGRVKLDDFHPPLLNRYLFRRDENICLYCGVSFPVAQLSRDHVVPVSRGGKDSWINVVTACRRCNHRKADRTPEEAGMELIAIPFAPNRYEFLYLANRLVLADQMEFLKSQFSRKERWPALVEG